MDLKKKSETGYFPEKFLKIVQDDISGGPLLVLGSQYALSLLSLLLSSSLSSLQNSPFLPFRLFCIATQSRNTVQFPMYSIFIGEVIKDNVFRLSRLLPASSVKLMKPKKVSKNLQCFAKYGLLIQVGWLFEMYITA